MKLIFNQQHELIRSIFPTLNILVVCQTVAFGVLCHPAGFEMVDVRSLIAHVMVSLRDRLCLDVRVYHLEGPTALLWMAFTGHTLTICTPRNPILKVGLTDE